jgi:hypothetical protein
MEKPNQKCNSCKKGLNNIHIGIIIFSIYMFITAIYGTTKLVELILNQF